jgi:hypothetical protein
MKKYLLLSSLFMSYGIFAATTATLQLKGTIAPILSIAIAPETIATSLPLDTSQTNTKIATVTERSNNSNGYSVTIVSTNLGKLVRNATTFVNYTMTYDNQVISLGSPSGSTFSNVFTNAAPVNKDIKISYTALNENLAVSGDYVDVVTFTITAN